MLKIMNKLDDEVTAKNIVEMYELLIPEADRKKIDKLKLNFGNFQTLVQAAISAVTGRDVNESQE